MLSAMRTLGIFGCGNVARLVAQRAPDLRIVAVYDRHPERREALAALTDAVVCESFDGLLEAEIDMVVETASVAGAKDGALAALEARRDLVVLSTGALLDDAFRAEVEATAARRGCRVFLPSGAVAGLDLLRTGRTEPFQRLLLRTTKPPHALQAGELTDRTCLFRGPAAECIERYPRNINVAASVAIASGCPVEVEIWADPRASSNTHEILAEGAFGRAQLRFENQPSPDNPRTSYLAALSVITLIRNMDEPLVIGG